MKWTLWLRVGIVFVFYQGPEVSAIQCEFWNETRQGVIIDCKEEMCFALWDNKSGEVEIKEKGCWGGGNVYSADECEGVNYLRPHGNIMHEVFCFCRTDRCNKVLKYVGTRTVLPPTPTVAAPEHKENNSNHLVFIFVPLGVVVVVILIFIIMYMRKRSGFKKPEQDGSRGSEVKTLIPTEELAPIDLKDVLSQGQFCNVRKGRMGYKDVAVKIFPITQCSKPNPSALTEEDIYIACKLNHENILKFIGKHIYEEGNQQQFWLVTEYIEQGSLSDFLKRNTISLENVFHMAQGMALGMAYLHAEIPRVKPSIAHRDIKSKNILVKNNLTCCISDFGLSLKFDNKDGPGDTHGQVGTRRYMAPEVLEGAINFSREAFLRIDMYAFALCLWELLTRCTDVNEEPVGDYKLPFEEEVGIHPSLEELQDYVVNKKMRPNLPAEWQNKDQAIDGMVVTIEECWDHDADARLTADCVAERVKQMRAVGKRQNKTPLAVSYKSLERENALLA